MRVSVLCFVLFTVATARYMTNDVKYADTDFMVKQKALFEIFMNVWQPEIHNTYYEEAKAFNYVDIKDKITVEDAYKCFVACYEKGFLKMEEIFTPMDAEHNHQMMSIFKMLYYAKDWDTFYKFLVWTRFNINPGMFIQAVTMAVLHRNDFEGFMLPAIYEVSPFYFFNSYVITKARRAELQGTTGMKKLDGDVYTYTVDTKYTDEYVTTNHESKLAYFMEGMYNA